MTIRSWACSATRAIFEDHGSSLLPPSLLRRASLKLSMLDAAGDLRDLSVPRGNRLEKLRGTRRDRWSIRINDQYRVCFVWRSGNAYEVEVVDYHR